MIRDNKNRDPYVVTCFVFRDEIPRMSDDFSLLVIGVIYLYFIWSTTSHETSFCMYFILFPYILRTLPR